VPALRQQDFAQWEKAYVIPKLQQFQTEINDWITKLSQFFEIPSVRPVVFSLPESPEVGEPAPDNNVKNTRDALDQVTPAALATGLGWVLAGPIGAAMVGGASILANKVGLNDLATSTDSYAQALLDAQIEAAEDYLCRLNLETKATIQAYRSQTAGVFDISITVPELIDPIAEQKLAALQTCLANLQLK
jgi:hypothetical protein